MCLIVQVCAYYSRFIVRVYLCRNVHLDRLWEAITGVLADPYFTIPTEEAKLCLEGARNIITVLSQTNELQSTFSTWLVTTLEEIVKSVQSDGQHFNKEKLWIKFHELTSSTEFANEWETFASKLGIGTVSPLLYQHITDIIFESIIKESTSTSTVDFSMSTGATQDCGLTFEEESAIHYVGGYVIRQLKMDKANVQMLPLLEQLTYSENSQADDDPMRHWVNQINRGGLTRITQEAFRCFYNIEITIRRFLKVDNTRDMNEQFNEKVMDSVLNDEDLLFDWCLASQFAVESDIADNCLKKIVKKWISVRGNSFAKNVMEIYKQTSKKGTQKAKPLRSKMQLFTDDI